MSQAIVIIDDAEYVGWESIEVQRTVDQAASTFSVGVSSPDKSFMFSPGSVVSVVYGGSVLVTGYIDTVAVEYSMDTHNISLEGRSKTKDIVDCSVLQDHLSEIKNKDIFQIAQLLCGPYGIQVRKSPGLDDLKKYPKFKPNHGETVHEALDRLASDSQVVLSDSPDGHLMLARLGKLATANTLVRVGTENTKIKSGRCILDESDKYSEVQVSGQKRGTDDNFGKKVTKISSTRIQDASVKRYRYKLIEAKHEMGQSDVDMQASFQQSGNVGKGLKVSYTLQDWIGNGGELWQENRLVSVSDDMFPTEANANLLIHSVRYRLDESGTMCELELVQPSMTAVDPKSSTGANPKLKQANPK